MGGHRISIADIATERFWQIAVLTAAGAIGFASPAEASRYYWSDYEPGYFQGRPARAAAAAAGSPSPGQEGRGAERISVKPQGPLIIAISIEQQTLKVYDANGFFAETPISTGMKGHPTPMGVFSIIQKHKLHHSNIYSGAPMPFMQRITWSGVAMHAGVLPGYPASHGCIRMPMAFAARMWNWTKMGARVVVTPGEITPARFSHPLLAEQKVVPPQPTAANEPNPDAPPAAKADKAADADATVKPAISEASLELRSTVGHDGVKPVDRRDHGFQAVARPDPHRGRQRRHPANASSRCPMPRHPRQRRRAPREGAAAIGKLPLIAADAAAAMAGDASKAEAKSEAAKRGG